MSATKRRKKVEAVELTDYSIELNITKHLMVAYRKFDSAINRLRGVPDYPNIYLRSIQINNTPQAIKEQTR